MIRLFIDNQECVRNHSYSIHQIMCAYKNWQNIIEYKHGDFNTKFKQKTLAWRMLNRFVKYFWRLIVFYILSSLFMAIHTQCPMCNLSKNMIYDSQSCKSYRLQRKSYTHTDMNKRLPAFSFGKYMVGYFWIHVY